MAIEEIEIEGYLGQNPKFNEQYPDMLNFSVGVSQTYKVKDSENWESKTTWYNVVCYDKNRSSYLSNQLFKGDKVVVKGKPTLKTWMAKDGKPNATISIALTKIALMKKAHDNREITNVDSPILYVPGVEEYYDKQKINAQTFNDEVPF